MSDEKLIKKRWHSVGHGFGWAHPDISGTETADHVVDDLYDIIERLNVKIDALEKQLKVQSEVIGFYSYKDNWIDNDYFRTTICESDWSNCGPINAIGGKRARECIQKIKELEGEI